MPTTFGNGWYYVGTGPGQIPPGVYTSNGAVGTHGFWAVYNAPYGARTSSDSYGESTEIRTNPLSVSILHTDFGFSTQSYGTWVKTGEAPKDFLLRQEDGSWKSLWGPIGSYDFSSRVRPDIHYPVLWNKWLKTGQVSMAVLMPDLASWQYVGSVYYGSVPVYSTVPVADSNIDYTLAPDDPNLSYTQDPRFFSDRVWYPRDSRGGVATGSSIWATVYASTYPPPAYPAVGPGVLDYSELFGVDAPASSASAGYDFLGNPTFEDESISFEYMSFDLIPVRWIRDTWYPGASVTLEIVGNASKNTRRDGLSSATGFKVWAATAPVTRVFPDTQGNVPRISITGRPSVAGVLVSGFGADVVRINMDSQLGSSDHYDLMFSVDPVIFDDFVPGFPVGYPMTSQATFKFQWRFL